MNDKMISFERKPAKQSKRQYILTIPFVYIKNGIIDPKKNYKIYMEEIKED